VAPARYGAAAGGVYRQPSSQPAAALAEKGIPLQVEEAEILPPASSCWPICQQQQVSHLFYNYQYEFNERQRDAAVEKTLAEVTCQGFDDSVLLPPGSVLTGNHEMYKVFTPFKNAFIRRLRKRCRSAWPRRKSARAGPSLRR
jgi:deoxyribodipyrimidine photo-lyase